MAADAQCAILLPPSSPVMRALVMPDGSRALSQDASYLQFIVEELVRFSAVKLAIGRDSLYYEAVEGLPRHFRDRIRFVDADGAVADKTRYLLEPVWNDASADFSFGALHLPSGMTEDVGGALVTLTSALRQFLIACDYNTQVGIDPQRLVECINTLLRGAREPQARATLATLQGVFRSYGERTTPSVVMRSQTPEIGVGFREFVEDEAYRTMAEGAFLLGLPARATLGVLKMRRSASELLRKPRFRQAADVGSGVVRTSTGYPLPAGEDVREVLATSSFLPPLISLVEAESRAAGAWRLSSAPFIPVGGSEGPEFRGAQALPPSHPDTWRLDVL